MDSNTSNKIKEAENELNNMKKKFDKAMITLCLIGILAAFAAGVLLIVGVVAENKVCEIVGIALNFLDILTLGVSLVRTITKFNADLAGLKNRNTKE